MQSSDDVHLISSRRLLAFAESHVWRVNVRVCMYNSTDQHCSANAMYEGYVSHPHRCLKGKPMVRPKGATIDVQHVDPQLASPLLRLPEGVRRRIYEHVFGRGNIHIGIRSCSAQDQWIPHWSSTELNPSKTKSYSSRKYSKITYAICKHDDWDRVYNLSKSSLPASLFGRDGWVRKRALPANSYILIPPDIYPVWIPCMTSSSVDTRGNAMPVGLTRTTNRGVVLSVGDFRLGYSNSSARPKQAA